MTTTFDKDDVLKGTHVAHPESKPRTISEVGVRESILEDIALKTLYLYGPFSVVDLSDQTRLSYDAAEELFTRLRTKLLCEVTGMMGKIPVIAISSQGRTRALDLLSHNQYSGAMPVSLASYVAQIRKQSMRKLTSARPMLSAPLRILCLITRCCRSWERRLTPGSQFFSMGPPGVGQNRRGRSHGTCFCRG